MMYIFKYLYYLFIVFYVVSKHGSKFILVIVMVVYLQSSMPFPMAIKKNPEECDDRMSMCGNELLTFMQNICQPKFFSCKSNITVPRSFTQEGILKRCCESYCTPRVLTLFFPCNESLRNPGSWIEDVEQFIRNMNPKPRRQRIKIFPRIVG